VDGHGGLWSGNNHLFHQKLKNWAQDPGIGVITDTQWRFGCVRSSLIGDITAHWPMIVLFDHHAHMGVLPALYGGILASILLRSPNQIGRRTTMNLKTNMILVATGVTIALTAAPSLAQVAPPPTKPAKPQPVYTPTKPAMTPHPQAGTRPAATPKPKSSEQMNARLRNRGDIEDLPINVPYPKLAKKGSDGRTLRLRQLPDILALRSNPNVGPKSVEKIMPIIYSRRYRYELMVIDNLDLYWQLTAGLIDNFDISDLTEMSHVAEMLKPLVGETTLSQELINRGILTRIQGGMNQYIVREYKKTITDEIQVLDGDKGLEEVMRFVLKDSIQEAEITYNAMLAEAMPQISKLIDEADATSPEAQALRSAEKPLTDDSIQQFRDIEEFDKAFRTLPYEEAMNIFKAMREQRKFPSLSPTVQTIDVLHPGKEALDKGFDMVIKDGKGNTVRNTKKDREEADSTEIPVKKSDDNN